jgi:hypothetical protein
MDLIVSTTLLCYCFVLMLTAGIRCCDRMVWWMLVIPGYHFLFCRLIYNIDKNPEYRRLAMGPLLDDLQRKMQKKANDGDKERLRLLVYSTHDTALAGLLSSLDTFDHR